MFKRVAGWLAHWVEYLTDKENNIFRPRQNYQGNTKRPYVGMEERKEVIFSFHHKKTFYIDSYKTST